MFAWHPEKDPMNRRFKLSIFAIVFLFLAGGIFVTCMPPTKAVSYEQGVKHQVVKTLLAMQGAYEARKIDEFMIWISKKYPKFKTFRSSVLSDFSASRDIKITVVTDKILVGEKGVDLNIHWYRTWKPYPGNAPVVKREGKGRLMFALDPLRLLFQTGDPLFGKPKTGG